MSGLAALGAGFVLVGLLLVGGSIAAGTSIEDGVNVLIFGGAFWLIGATFCRGRL